MAITPMLIISAVIVGGFFSIVIGATIHNLMFRLNQRYDEEGRPERRSWEPNNYSREQRLRMAEVRWYNRRMLWLAARDARREQGLGPPDHYPGDVNPYNSSDVFTSAESPGPFWPTHSNVETDSNAAVSDIGLARRRIPYLEEETRNSDEGEYGGPSASTSGANSRWPYMLRRWTQHGAPRRSQQQFEEIPVETPRLQINDEDVPPTPYNSDSEQRPQPRLTMAHRASSVYSRDNLNQLLLQPPIAYMPSPIHDSDAETHLQLAIAAERARSDRRAARLERARGASVREI